jgi:predicted Zn-dependent protease
VASLTSGRPREAMHTAGRALALEPRHEVATLALAVALSELGAPEAAVWLARARRTSPQDPLLTRLAR